MSLMATISKPQDRPVLMTVCGDAGTGKTSLAATFPKPIFIRAEDGLQAIPAAQRPDAFPILRGPQDLWDQMIALLQENHDYKTLVIDSVTALERMFVQDVLDSDKKAKSINQAMGGYGAGPAAVAAMHQRVRKAAGLLNERKGMHVVFVAHADVETMRLPDADDYMRYSLRLPSKSLPPYVDDVDLVGFLRLETFTKGADGERKKAISTGDRQLVCHADAACVSKNRFGITEPLECTPGVNPLLGLVPSLGKPKGKAKEQPKPEPEQTEETEETGRGWLDAEGDNE